MIKLLLNSSIFLVNKTWLIITKEVQTTIHYQVKLNHMSNSMLICALKLPTFHCKAHAMQLMGEFS